MLDCRHDPFTGVISNAREDAAVDDRTILPIRTVGGGKNRAMCACGHEPAIAESDPVKTFGGADIDLVPRDAVRGNENEAIITDGDKISGTPRDGPQIRA